MGPDPAGGCWGSWALGHLSWEGGLPGSGKGFSILLSSWAILAIHSFILPTNPHWSPVGCQGFLSVSNGKEPTCQCRRCSRPRFSFWVGRIPWRRKWQPSPVFLRKSHGQRELDGLQSIASQKSQTQLSDSVSLCWVSGPVLGSWDTVGTQQTCLCGLTLYWGRWTLNNEWPS